MSAPTTQRKATGVFSPTRAELPQRTLRVDKWWAQTVWVDLGFAAFLIYGLVRASWQAAYYVPAYHYLTPFYSPCVSASCVPGSSHLGVWFPEFPPLIPLAIVTLPFLLLFRLTCYYYRKAYYRSVWQSPPACAVAEPHSTYTGETRLPLLIQNSHRYFFYVAVLISLINTYDAVMAFRSPQGFGFGVGNLILVGNVILLWIYTLSCHSCRHVVGGRLKHFSKHPVRYWLWTQVSKINERHMMWAWITLGTLVVTDFYVMLISMHPSWDFRFVGHLV